MASERSNCFRLVLGRKEQSLTVTYAVRTIGRVAAWRRSLRQRPTARPHIRQN